MTLVEREFCYAPVPGHSLYPRLYSWYNTRGSRLILVGCRLLRILLVSRYPPVHCGVAEYTRMLARALLDVEPRLELIVASTREEMRAPYRDKLLGVEVHPVYDRGDTLEGYLEGLRSLLRRVGGVDVAHLQHEYGIFGCNEGILHALHVLHEEGLIGSVLVTMHTVYHPLWRRCAASTQEYLAKTGFHVIVHNVLQEFELINQGVAPDKLHLVPHGTLVNPHLAAPRRQLLEAFGVEHEGGVLALLPGFIRRDKGVDTLVEALRGLDGIHVIVAGEPRDEELVAMLRSSPNVTLVPRYLPSEALQMLMASVDLVVLPYRDVPGAYSTSGVLHLAMGSFRAIIGSRTPRLLELYQRAPRATFPQGNAAALRRLLAVASRDPEAIVEMEAGLYSYAVETRWDAVARRHLDIYAELSQRRR